MMQSFDKLDCLTRGPSPEKPCVQSEVQIPNQEKADSGVATIHSSPLERYLRLILHIRTFRGSPDSPGAVY